MRMAWSLKMTDIVHETSQRVLKRDGCLLDKLGFSFEQFSPRYRDTNERYNPETYNNPIYPQQSSNLPMKTDNVVDAAEVNINLCNI